MKNGGLIQFSVFFCLTHNEIPTYAKAFSE